MAGQLPGRLKMTILSISCCVVLLVPFTGDGNFKSLLAVLLKPNLAPKALQRLLSMHGYKILERLLHKRCLKGHEPYQPIFTQSKFIVVTHLPQWRLNA